MSSQALGAKSNDKEVVDEDAAAMSASQAVSGAHPRGVGSIHLFYLAA